MTHYFEVLIVGGGIVGLTASLAMARRGYKVALLDAGDLKVDVSVPDLRVYAINKASHDLLAELGVWQVMEHSRLSPYNKMHVWDAANGAVIDFDSRSIAAPNLGSIIEESVLKQALLQQVAQKPNINLFAQSPVSRVQTLAHGIRIYSDEQIWEGQLALIADGANSPTRNKLGVELTSWSYKQQAIIAKVSTEKPHLSVAYQVFNKDGPLAFLPLADPHQCSIVWSTQINRAEKLMALDENEFSLELTKAFAGHLGTVHRISASQQFPLHMRHVKQYVGEHWLLLGDAAHTIHPLAGLGLNLGLADVFSWMQILDRNKSSLASKKALGAYQRERKAAVWQAILLMDAFKHLFGTSLAPITSLRNLGMRACNACTPLKRLFIQHAAG